MNGCFDCRPETEAERKRRKLKARMDYYANWGVIVLASLLLLGCTYGIWIAASSLVLADECVMVLAAVGLISVLTVFNALFMWMILQSVKWLFPRRIRFGNVKLPIIRAKLPPLDLKSIAEVQPLDRSISEVITEREGELE